VQDKFLLFGADKEVATLSQVIVAAERRVSPANYNIDLSLT
jgi:hypothetical protein